MINNNLVLFLLILAIVFLEYTVQKRQLGIVLLHNNDHTLNKIVQYLTAFFERLEVHFHIVVIKTRDKVHSRSTGKLFNIGYRQMSKLDGYLFIDSKYCKLEQIQKILSKSSRLNSQNIYPKNKIQILDEICGVLVSRDYLKKIDGFSNEPNKSFNEFLKILENDKNSKHKYGGYLSTNFDTKYHIMERTQLSNNAVRLVIKFK